MKNNGVHKTEAGWKKGIIIKRTAEQITLTVKIEDKIRKENGAQVQLKCEQVIKCKTSYSKKPKLSKKIVLKLNRESVYY